MLGREGASDGDLLGLEDCGARYGPSEGDLFGLPIRPCWGAEGERSGLGDRPS